MLNLVKYLAANLVDNPDAVSVSEEIDPSGTHLLNLTVDPQDMGKIIGKGGKIINSIRELTKVKAIKQGLRVKLILKDQPQTDLPSPSAPAAELPETG